MSPRKPASPVPKIAALLERLARLGRAGRFRRGLNPAQEDALNYLAVANRYSRNPSALADFLGSTRGTVSQTLIALERKGLIARRADPRDGRAIALELTREGRILVDSGEETPVATAVRGLSGANQAVLAGLLAEVLAEAQRQHGFRTFGICGSCIHFQRDGSGKVAGGPHRCGLTQEPLSDSDSILICREHTTPKAA
ncbi:MAG: MarR family transcriptional regulator [Rhodospirillales bacterium]|nr:MarR family transcriptional regulator [Rhodospirillales bacterium]